MGPTINKEGFHEKISDFWVVFSNIDNVPCDKMGGRNDVGVEEKVIVRGDDSFSFALFLYISGKRKRKK